MRAFEPTVTNGPIDTWSPLPLGWHTYGMEWGPGYQLYNIDGRITVRVYGDHVPSDKHYILLNSGIASDNPPTAATVFPNSFDVDYARVYAHSDGTRNDLGRVAVALDQAGVGVDG